MMGVFIAGFVVGFVVGLAFVVILTLTSRES